VKNKIIIMLIFFGIISFFINSIQAENFDFNKWISNETNYKLFNYFKTRAIEGNHWYINYRPELNESDKITETQAINRIKAILITSHKLNYMYPKILPRRIFKDFNAILEYETHFVNYANQDDGMSFGVPALTWKTAQIAIDELGYNLNIYRKKNITDNLRYDYKYNIYFNENHRNYLRQYPELQIELGVWYYYRLLKKYYNGNRLLALTGYNTGPGLNKDNPRFRNYYFNIRGRINYYEEQLIKLGN